MSCSPKDQPILENKFYFNWYLYICILSLDIHQLQSTIHILFCWIIIITLCNIRWNKFTVPSAVIKTVLTSLILKSPLQSWVSEKFILSRKLYDTDSCQQMGIITLSIINAIWRASIVMELLCNCTLIKWSSNYSVISWWFVLYKIFALHKQTMLSYNSERMWVSACWYWNICQIFMVACSRNSDCLWAYFL